MDIGKRIKDRRKQLGISAETLAEAISVSPATIYRYESGDIEHMGVDKLTPIARYLGTNEAYLMGWTDDPSFRAFNSSSSDSHLTKDEEVLIGYYRAMNKEGREKLTVYAEDLAASGRYIKTDQGELVDPDAAAVNK